MATIYVKFQAQDTDGLVHSTDCTTRWPDSVSCSIPMSGVYGEKYTNLMKMTGDEIEIRNWISTNSGKVIELTEEECNTIGQEMIPEGTTSVIDESEGDKIYRRTYTASEFSIITGQTWTLTESLDITP